MKKIVFNNHPEIIAQIPNIKNYLLNLQKRICTALEEQDGHSKFLEDEWTYKEKGGGITKVLTSNAVIEKAGVNFSHVLGQSLPKAATDARPDLANSSFQALGISVVIHPINPFVPTTHMNVRFILVENADKEVHWWFGGGFDLTPYYGFEEDCVHWHQMAKSACAELGADYYAKYKTWCDNYFYLAHRNEPRGIGGIFFDDLNKGTFEECFAFMQSVGDHFMKAYFPILNKRKNHPYSKEHTEFQHYRRGRYVEFNLLYDRGTLFGIQSGGRTESILMSLPPIVTWTYDFKPPKDSAEAELYEYFLKPKNWLAN